MRSERETVKSKKVRDKVEKNFTIIYDDQNRV